MSEVLGNIVHSPVRIAPDESRVFRVESALAAPLRIRARAAHSSSHQ